MMPTIGSTQLHARVMLFRRMFGADGSVEAIAPKVFFDGHDLVKVDPYVVSSKDPRKRRLFLQNHARELRHFSFFLHVSILSTLRGSTTASGRNQGWASFVSSGR